jgi:hypothetical protein
MTTVRLYTVERHHLIAANVPHSMQRNPEEPRELARQMAALRN